MPIKTDFIEKNAKSRIRLLISALRFLLFKTVLLRIRIIEKVELFALQNGPFLGPEGLQQPPPHGPAVSGRLRPHRTAGGIGLQGQSKPQKLGPGFQVQPDSPPKTAKLRKLQSASRIFGLLCRLLASCQTFL